MKMNGWAEHIVACMEALMGNVRALHFLVHSVGDSGALALAALKEAPLLHTLTLDLQ